MNPLQITDLDGHSLLLNPEELTLLKDRVKGDLIFPDSKNYEKVRKVWNGLIDKKPAVIVQVTDSADVLAAVNFAIKNKIPLTAKGGGHSVAGNCMIDGGMVLDFSRMKKIEVDRENQLVKVQSGATWGDLDKETQKYGLATPGGLVSDSGITGLTLGGGYGWIRRTYGLSCDNVLSVEIVSGKGELLKADANENPDLFWAVRGGGGNFGIVTSFTYTLHEVGPELYTSLSFHPLESATETLAFYRNFISNARDEINSIAIFGNIAPSPKFPETIHGRPFVLLAACYAGAVDKGKKELEALRNYGNPMLRINDAMPYLAIQQLFDEDYPTGRLYYWKSLYFNQLNEEVNSLLKDCASRKPSPLTTINIWHMGGAIRKNKNGAFPNRDSEFMLSIESNWNDHKDTEKNINWTREVFKAMQPYASGGSYLNFSGFFEEGDQTFFGKNQVSLEEIKAKYDPNHLFRLHK